MNTDNFNIRLDEDITNQMTVNKNLSQEIIVTNTDKVTIILNDHHKIIRKKIEWISPLGILISVLATLLTTEFNKVVLGVDAILWRAIFVVTGLASFFYSSYLIYFAIKYAKNGTIDEFIEKLKNQSREINNPAFVKSKDRKMITINSARYGTEKAYYDITEKLSRMISENNFVIKANNDLWGDPANGERKTLRVACTIDGKKKQITILENETINLLHDSNL